MLQMISRNQVLRLALNHVRASCLASLVSIKTPSIEARQWENSQKCFLTNQLLLDQEARIYTLAT